MDILETTVRRELVSHAAGRQMFCQICRAALRNRTTCLITRPREDGGGCRALCPSCLTTTRIQAALDAGCTIDHWDWTRTRAS